MRDRALEKVKAAVFIGSNAAFLGCLMCRLNFRWSTEVETAGVTDTTFLWNPDWFDSLTFEERKGVLLHELWHIALLHGLRKGNKNYKKWNIACDHRINNNLSREGVKLPKGAVCDIYFEDDSWSEEKIYGFLDDDEKEQTWGTQELSESPSQVSLVQTAIATAKLSGTDPGRSSQLLKELLKPKLPWKQLLHKYLLEKFNKDYSFARPNRRFQDIYLPSLRDDDGRLVNIAMFLDTSGSITEEEIKRFVSEVKFVKDNLNPKELRVVQFDTQIQDEIVYNEFDSLKQFKVKGFGGTNYKCVHKYIMEHKPTLSLIFTDLYANEMDPVGKLDVIWISSTPDLDGPFGETIHV